MTSVKVSQISERIMSSFLSLGMDLLKVVLVCTALFGYLFRIAFTLVFITFEFFKLLCVSDSTFVWILRAVLALSLYKYSTMLFLQPF